MNDDANGQNEGNGKKILPPYLPFRTLKAFVDGLQVGVPNQIDRSLMRSMAGGMQSQVLKALEFLHLTEEGGAPTNALREWVDAQGEARKKVLAGILKESYTFLFQGDFNLSKATPNELNKKFADAGASGDTIRKGVGFFIAAAKEAGLEISPHIIAQARRGPRAKSPNASRGRTPRKKKDVPSPPGGKGRDEPKPQLTGDFKTDLLSKMPQFDPNWDEQTRASWLETYKEVARILGEGKGGLK